MKNIYDFRVGDKVWSVLYGFEEITRIHTNDDVDYPLETYDNRCFRLDGLYYEDSKAPSLFHAGAVTLDDKGRLLSVDYNYRPTREEIKKEYQFKPKDWVLVRYNDTLVWKLSIFSHINEHGIYVCVCGYHVHCIPYEGNEHLLGTTINF